MTIQNYSQKPPELCFPVARNIIQYPSEQEKLSMPVTKPIFYALCICRYVGIQ